MKKSTPRWTKRSHLRPMLHWDWLIYAVSLRTSRYKTSQPEKEHIASWRIAQKCALSSTSTLFNNNRRILAGTLLVGNEKRAYRHQLTYSRPCTSYQTTVAR